MKNGDTVLFVPASPFALTGPHHLTVTYAGDKHFQAGSYTFKRVAEGPMLGIHNAGSAWASEAVYDDYARSLLAWSKLRDHVRYPNKVPAGVTADDLETALKLLKIK